MTSLNLAILNLVSYGGQFLERAEAELERRVARDRRVEAEGTNYEEEAQHQKAVSSFNIKIHYATKEINNICHTYKVWFVCIICSPPTSVVIFVGKI